MLSPCCPSIRQMQAVPALLPPAHFQLLHEAEDKRQGTAEGQACRGSPWPGTALVPDVLSAGKRKTNLLEIRIPMVSISITN